MALTLTFQIVCQSSGLYRPYWGLIIVLAWLTQGPIPLTQAQAPQQAFIYQLVPIDSESGDIVYTAVVPVAGLTTTQLYNRAHHFLAHTVHAGSLLPMAHGAKHHINRCGIITLPQTGSNQPQDYRVTIELTVKTGQYRYRLSQFRAHPDSMGAGLPVRELYQVDKQTYEYGASTAQQLRAWDRHVKAYLSLLHEYMVGRR